MNVDLEDRIVGALRAEAESAPAAGDLLARVHGRARQRARRRVAGISAVVTGALALTVVGAAALGGSPGASSRLNRLATSPAGPLEAGGLPPLEFPITPGWLPAGVSTEAQVSSGDSGLSASYYDSSRPQFSGIDIWSGPRDLTFQGAGVTTEPTTINGHAAVIGHLADSVSIAWQTSPNSWLTVMGGNEWGAEPTVRHVAESLVMTPFPVTLPFTLTSRPANSELADWSTLGSAVFVPTGQTSEWRTSRGAGEAVTITAHRTVPGFVGDGDPVTVAGHPGWLSETNGQLSLAVQITPQISEVFTTPLWDQADLLKLAEGTTYTGGMPPGEG